MARPRGNPRPSAVRLHRHEKLLGRNGVPVPQTDTGRRGDFSAGDRETLCEGIRQIGPVTSGEGAPPPVAAPRELRGRRAQGIGSTDCLPKTQVSAKPQGDVWGLTPARCQTVKGRRVRSAEPKPW